MKKFHWDMAIEWWEKAEYNKDYYPPEHSANISWYNLLMWKVCDDS